MPDRKISDASFDIATNLTALTLPGVQGGENVRVPAETLIQPLTLDWSDGAVANSPDLSIPAYIGRSWIDVGALGSDADNAKAAIDQAISEASGGGKVLRFTSRNYLLTNSSQMSFFIPDNTIVEGLPGNFIDASTAPLDPGLATTERSIIRCEGTLDATTYALATNASANAFSITLGSGVAASMGLSRGDLLLISSDALFPSGSAYPTTAHCGEVRTVYSVSGDNINFFEPLQDNYLTSDNAKVQKRTDWRGKVLGLKVRGRGVFPSADTGRGDTGIRLKLARNAEVAGNVVQDCALMSYVATGTIDSLIADNKSIKERPTVGKPSYGIGYFDGNQGLTIRSNSIRGGNSGITHTESGDPGVDRDILIESNFLEGSGEASSSNGIGAHTTGERVTARGNIIKGYGNGLNASCKHFVSENNQVRQMYSGGSGITISERLEYFRSSGDTFEGGQYGISLVAADTQLSGTSGPIEITIEGVRAFNQSTSGIHLTYNDTTDAKKGLWIRNSVVRNCGGHCVTVSGSFTEGRIESLDVDGNAAFRSLNVSGVTDIEISDITYKTNLPPLISGTRNKWRNIRLWGETSLPTKASASTIDFRPQNAFTHDAYLVTGTAEIRLIQGASGFLGRRLTLFFESALVVSHNNNGTPAAESVLFQSATNLNIAAGGVLELVSDGSSWRPVGAREEPELDWSGGTSGAPTLSVPNVMQRRYVDIGAYCSLTDTDSARAGIVAALAAGGEGREFVFTNPFGGTRYYKVPDRAGGRIYLPTAKTFRLICEPGAIIDFSGFGNGAGLTSSPYFYGTGSVGTEHVLTANALTDTNTVTVSTSDAANYARGNDIFVRSNALFTTEDSTIGTQGEWATVLSVNTGTGVITLGAKLRANYNTADGAYITKVTPISGSVENLNIIGAGRFADNTSGDRGLQIVTAKNFNVIGGNFQFCDFHGPSFTNVLNGLVDGTRVEFDAKGSTTGLQYGIAFVNMCENTWARNCDINGGSEGLVLSTTGQPQGVTRDVGFESCRVRGSTRSGACSHDNHENWSVINCTFEDCEQGIDHRINGLVATGNTMRRMGAYSGALSCGLQLGSGAGKVLFANNVLEDMLRGVYHSDATIDETATGAVGDIMISGNVMRNIGQYGVFYGVEATDDTTARGSIKVIGNDISMTAGFGVEIEGYWDNPVVMSNTFRGGNAGRSVYLHNTSAGAGFGPISPVVACNVWDNYADVLIVHDTGQRTEFENHKIGTPSTRLSYVAASGAASATHTGNTDETELASVSIPANMMGPNGWIEIDVTFGTPGGSANTKTCFVKYNGSSGTTYYQVNVTTALSLRAHVIIQNRNSTSSQAGGAATILAGGFGSSTAAVPTSAIDTTAARTISFKGDLANAADSILVERYSVKVFYAQ